HAQIKGACLQYAICGTILLAPEGINGTIAGTQNDLAAIIDVLDHITGIRSGELKFSTAHEKPFQRMKVRLKKEIITMKKQEANPTFQTGIHVDAKDWNTLISDPDVLVLDTRNTYETKEGMFKNALDPRTAHFSHFPDFVKKHLDPARHKKIAMYCTGGIR